ncbi:MAG: hypothetical protein ACW99Q_26695, partial [Candidatus Kariarchaeaceae archaeon]
NDNWELEFPSNGTTIPILPGSVNIDRFVLVINGQNYWNSSQTGYSIQYGKASAVDEQIVDVHGSFNAKTYNFEGSFYPSTLYKDTYFVLNSTDGSRIEIQDRPLGRIFEMTFNSSTTPVNANTTYDFYNYYDWNGTHSFYTYISLTGENLTSVDVDASVSVFYDYLAIFNNALGEWQFNYDGAVVSYNTWISDWSFYITWDQFVTIDSVDYIITDQIWISGDEYNFTYGFLSGWSYVDVGWFIALTDFGTYFYEWYEYLLNQTTMEEIRVNSTEVRVLWKVLLNGSLLVYTANSWLYDDWDTYYEVESYNGSYYQFFTLDDFEYLDEIHVYPENGLYNFSGDDLDFFSYYSFGTYLAEIDGQIVELESNEYWTPIITVFYQGQDRTLSFREEPILRRISHYGYPFREMYVWDWSIKTESSVWAVVVGNPRSNMWGFDAYTVNPDNGALDLDGDLSTTSDQYYVRRVWQTTNNYTEQYNRLEVQLHWDPDTSTFDNEYNLFGWMGSSTTTYTWDWSETFIWYYAENTTQISASTLADIQATMLNGDEPAAGYWGIAWMLDNRTWADTVAEALENGWDWIESNTETYTWLDFGFSQSYFTFTFEGGTANWIFNELETSWSGLWIYDDMNEDGIADFGSDEISHTFIPTSVGQLVFTTPGIAFGDTSPSGTINLVENHPDFNTTVDFGVQFLDVNGTTYPVIRDVFGDYGSYWDWHSTGIAGSDYNGFANRPADV